MFSYFRRKNKDLIAAVIVTEDRRPFRIHLSQDYFLADDIDFSNLSWINSFENEENKDILFARSKSNSSVFYNLPTNNVQIRK